MFALTTDSDTPKSAESRRLAAANRYPEYGTTLPPRVFPGEDHRVEGPTQVVVVTASPFSLERSLLLAYLYCLFFGLLGFHHFYLRRYGFGILYFCTGGLMGVGWLVDIIRLPWLVREANQKSRRPLVENFPQVDLVDAYLLWFPFGLLGFHHYYLRRPLWGIAYTLSGGLLGIGWMVDAFRIPSLVRRTNERLRLEHFEGLATPGRQFQVNLCDAYLLCLVPPLGIFGAHHFYLRRYIAGLFYLFTLGGGGIGWIVDWFRLKCLVARVNHPERLPLGQRQKFLDEAYVYAFPMGVFGTHHFYLERPAWGVLYLFTGGLCGIGWLVDLCRMPCLVRHANARISNELALRTAAATSGDHQHQHQHQHQRQHLPSGAVIITTTVVSVAGTVAHAVGQLNYSNQGGGGGGGAAAVDSLHPPPYQPDNTSWISIPEAPPQSESRPEEPPPYSE